MRCFGGKREGKRKLGRLGVNGKVILNWTFKTQARGMEWIDLAHERDK